MPDTDTPYAYADVCEIVRDLVREGFRSHRVESPDPDRIELRARIGDIRVESGDSVTFYEGGDTDRTRAGNRHDDEKAPVKVDIRSASRNRAKELLWAVKQIMEWNSINPHSEWSELLCGHDRVVASYDGDRSGDYTHIVLDVELRKHLRLRPTPRAFGGRLP